jgi:lipopolysaccharide export system protein LptA
MSHTQLLVFSSVRLVLLRLTALPILLSAILPPALAAPAVVTPTSGLVTIESDLQKADNSTGVVTATGNVRIVYPDQRVVATARQAQYFSREGRVVLSGDVDVIQDSGHSIRAERLVYLVERERIVAEPTPGQQVITHYRMNAPRPKQGLTP